MYRISRILVIPVAIAVSLLFLFAMQSVGSIGASMESPVDLPQTGDSHILCFDTELSDFVFTSTIPISDAGAWDIEVLPGSVGSEVWFTVSDADQIGTLFYTDTQDFVYEFHPLPSGSRPLNLVLDESYAWFTEPGRNRIGRLDRATGVLEEFEIPTPDSYPADIDIAPDGTIWFTEMHADKIAHLVTTPTGYQINEHTRPSMSGARPYGIVASHENGVDVVYVAQTEHDYITYFEPATGVWANIAYNSGFGTARVPDGPFRLIPNPNGGVWGTEKMGNRVSQFRFGGTTPELDYHSVDPPASVPNGLSMGAAGDLWFAQEFGGQIGVMITSRPFTKTYYPLPLSDLAPLSVASDAQGHCVWVLAVEPSRLFVPAILRSN